MKVRIPSLLLATLVTLTACGGAPQSVGTKQGDVLRVAIGIDIDTLDPAAQFTTTVSQMVDMMAETLVGLDASGQIKPLLAEKWETSSDGLTYTFTLRKGVKFQDGTDFNAQAVKFSFDRIISPDTYHRRPGILTSILSTSVMDDYHVKITLKSRVSGFVPALVETIAAIISPASVTTSGNTLQQVKVPVGTGPYKYKERVEGDHLAMVRNDAYWGPKPSYREQVYSTVAEVATREALLRSGQVDVIFLTQVSDLPSLRADKSLKVLMAESDRTVQININTKDAQAPLLQNAKVRQALNYAVDKDAIIRNTLLGAADPLRGPMPNILMKLLGDCPLGDPYRYDPARARTMLQDAGAAGLSLKLIAPTGRYLQDFQVAQKVAGYLREVGVQVDGPATMEWPTYAARVNSPLDKASTDLDMIGLAVPAIDLSTELDYFVTAAFPPKGLNSAYYSNPSVDNLISNGNAEGDARIRTQDYCGAVKQIWADAPWIFLYNQRLVLAHSTKVTGLTTFPTEKFNTVTMSPT